MARIATTVAAGLGYLIRLLLWLVGFLPIGAGIAVAMYGLWLAWPPLFYIVGGVLIVALSLPRSANGRA